MPRSSVWRRRPSRWRSGYGTKRPTATRRFETSGCIPVGTGCSRHIAATGYLGRPDPSVTGSGYVMPSGVGISVTLRTTSSANSSPFSIDHLPRIEDIS